MTSKKMKDRKKKRRERESKANVIKHREALHQHRKYEKGIDEDIRASREKLEPFVDKKKIIARNLEIIKGLEEDYKREQKRRASLNKKLESQGHSSFVEKMGAMRAQVQESLVTKTKKTLEMLHGTSLEPLEE